MANIRASKKMNEKKKVPQRGLGVPQLERIRLEEQHKKDSIFQSVQCPNFIPTSSRTDFSSKNCVFRPNQSAPFLENCPKLLRDEYNLEGVNKKVDHHGVVFGQNVNLPSGPHSLRFPLLQKSRQYQQTSSSSSMVNVSSGISSSSSVQSFQMEPPSSQSYCGCTNCLPLWPEDVKMAGMKRRYPFSPEDPPIPSFRGKFPQCCVSPVSRSHESVSSSNDCSVYIEDGDALKREVVSQSRALSESKPSTSVRETKARNGDFLNLAPPASALPHLEAVNPCSLTNSAPQTLELFDYVPAQVAAAQHTPPSGQSISFQQPILRFFPTAMVQIGQERTHGSDFHTEVGGKVDLELKL
ncbi:uncharacterized protein LOC132627078 [Lycium barbarum]|uniref:uncharacterized protein LOC132627078 n=1 Tax=Lycium barbarum TaxID=112863 RepID=UPI00293ECED4|nr:uncharacterized protein LOC132627078 [Lycium barbarum]